jgi:hypothetical protein
MSGPAGSEEPAAAAGSGIVVVMPAYNAALTLERTYADIPHPLVERIILVDDVSGDRTVEIAHRLGLDVIVHRQNQGYGGNQKTCYDAALAAGAQVVVMLHPDYQYDATRIPALIEPILGGRSDLMLGSRFLGDPLAGGMPRWKYVSNRFLTTLENVVFGLRLSEYHTGFRAYSRELLETIPYRLNSDDFVFDQELVAQAVTFQGHSSSRAGLAAPAPILRRAASRVALGLSARSRARRAGDHTPATLTGRLWRGRRGTVTPLDSPRELCLRLGHDHVVIVPVSIRPLPCPSACVDRGHPRIGANEDLAIPESR